MSFENRKRNRLRRKRQQKKQRGKFRGVTNDLGIVFDPQLAEGPIIAGPIISTILLEPESCGTFSEALKELNQQS